MYFLLRKKAHCSFLVAPSQMARFAMYHSQETHFVWFFLLFKGAPCSLSVSMNYTPVTKVSGQPKQNGVEFDR